MVSNDRKCPKYRASKNIRRTILWLAKNQAVFETPRELLCKEFSPFLGPDGSKKCFLGAMDCSLREASRKGQSIASSKSGNDGRIEESSRRLHWSDITATLDLITLYNMFRRADIQRSKEALQISLMTQEIISNIVAFLTKGAHTLEVLHRVHPSALLMMHTCHNLWGVSSKKKSITGNT